MKYFLTGGTGFIGSRVVRRLVEDGHEVVAVTRDRANAADLPDEVEVVEGDVRDKETLREPMRGVDGVFHIAAWYFVGPGPEKAQMAREINIDGTRNVLELVQELEIPKAVYTSTIGVMGDVGEGPVDETFRYERPLPTVYQETKWIAQYQVARPMMQAGLPLVVVMPGIVYGPGQKEMGTLRVYIKRFLRGTLPVVPRGRTFSYDHVEDTARAHVQAMDRGTPGEEYFIGSTPMTVDSALETVADILDRRPPRAVPPWVIGFLASAMGVLEHMITPPKGFEAEALRFLAESNFDVDNAKARRDLGLEHRPFEEGIREYLEWELEKSADESGP